MTGFLKSDTTYRMREFLHATGGFVVGAVLGGSIDALIIETVPPSDGRTLALYGIFILATAIGGATGRFGGKLADMEAGMRQRNRLRRRGLL